VAEIAPEPVEPPDHDLIVRSDAGERRVEAGPGSRPAADLVLEYAVTSRSVERVELKVQRLVFRGYAGVADAQESPVSAGRMRGSAEFGGLWDRALSDLKRDREGPIVEKKHITSPP